MALVLKKNVIVPIGSDVYHRNCYSHVRAHGRVRRNKEQVVTQCVKKRLTRDSDTVQGYRWPRSNLGIRLTIFWFIHKLG